MKSLVYICLALSGLSFLYQVNRIADLEKEAVKLQAEIDSKTSTSAVVGGAMKSFFDGFTFGIFADEGIFTEYNRYNRWTEDVTQRIAVLEADYKSTKSKRNWSLFVALGCGAWLAFQAMSRREA